jgi:hypothetical protein
VNARHKLLLAVDGAVNVILGTLLLLSPFGLIELLGLPPAGSLFYPVILGAVLLGIGLALFLELLGSPRQVRGLGLGGAIVINLIGASALIAWLVFGSPAIALRGRALLWAVGLLVFLIAVAELASKSFIQRR